MKTRELWGDTALLEPIAMLTQIFKCRTNDASHIIPVHLSVCNGKKTSVEINTGFSSPLVKRVVEPEVKYLRKPSPTSEVCLYEEIKR